MDVELRQLRHVLVLAEHRNFARAASALGITQPALSRSVQNLERAVGSAIFDRRRQGVEPTDTGRLLLQRARELLSFSDDFAREVNLTRGLQRGRIACGAGPYPAEMSVGTAAGRFAATYPGVQIELRVRNWDDLLRALRGRELDFFVAETSTFEKDSDLEIVPLAKHALYLVGRARHPLAGRCAGLPDVLQYPLVAPARIPPRLLEPLLHSRPRITPPLPERAFPSIECVSLSVLKRIVMTSDAVTALTLSAMSEELADGRLAVLRTEPWLRLRYGIVRLKNRALTSAASMFLSFVTGQESETARAEAKLARAHLSGRGKRRRRSKRG